MPAATPPPSPSAGNTSCTARGPCGLPQFPVGAGLSRRRTAAKQATRWMAPASPVFAGKPAPTGFSVKSDSYDLFHRSGLEG
ncbi:hypothetical protein F3J45_12810 [Pantoea sp. Ap-967]|nr:hypothetical protein [Pantoea sp. Ap-967]